MGPLLAAGLALCVAGCKTDAETAEAANAPCWVAAKSSRLRDGEHWPVFYRLKNTGEWCATSFSADGGPYRSAVVRDNPSHGEVRITQHPGSTAIAYRPASGYEGADSFQVVLTGNRGSDVMMDIGVTVRHP